jgi:hypothetical protein
MVMIVLSLILLTYYTTVFLVYGRIALSHSSKSHAATGVIIVYNFLVRRRAGRPAGVAKGLETLLTLFATARYSCCCGATLRRC